MGPLSDIKLILLQKCFTQEYTLHEPHTYRETSTDHLWQISIKEELVALSSNHTWELVTLPPLGNLWLVVSGSTRSKLALMGPLSDIKLILLQKCFIQEYEIDYKETFTPVVQISFVRAFLAVIVASK